MSFTLLEYIKSWCNIQAIIFNDDNIKNDFFWFLQLRSHSFFVLITLTFSIFDQIINHLKSYLIIFEEVFFQKHGKNKNLYTKRSNLGSIATLYSCKSCPFRDFVTFLFVTISLFLAHDYGILKPLGTI